MLYPIRCMVVQNLGKCPPTHSIRSKQPCKVVQPRNINWHPCEGVCSVCAYVYGHTSRKVLSAVQSTNRSQKIDCQLINMPGWAGKVSRMPGWSLLQAQWMFLTFPDGTGTSLASMRAAARCAEPCPSSKCCGCSFARGVLEIARSQSGRRECLR